MKNYILIFFYLTAVLIISCSKDETNSNIKPKNEYALAPPINLNDAIVYLNGEKQDDTFNLDNPPETEATPDRELVCLFVDTSDYIFYFNNQELFVNFCNLSGYANIAEYDAEIDTSGEEMISLIPSPIFDNKILKTTTAFTKFYYELSFQGTDFIGGSGTPSFGSHNKKACSFEQTGNIAVYCDKTRYRGKRSWFVCTGYINPSTLGTWNKRICSMMPF